MIVAVRSNCPHRALPDRGWGRIPRPWGRSGNARPIVRAATLALATLFASTPIVQAQNFNAATKTLLTTLNFCLQKQDGPSDAIQTAAKTGWRPATAQDVETYFTLLQDWRYADALKKGRFGNLALRMTGLKPAQLKEMHLHDVVRRMEKRADRPKAISLSRLVGENTRFAYLVKQESPRLFAVISFAQSTTNVQKQGWYQKCTVLGTDQDSAKLWFDDPANPVDPRPQIVPLTVSAQLRQIGQTAIDAPAQLELHRRKNTFMREMLGLDTQLAAHIKTSLSIPVPSELQSETTS